MEMDTANILVVHLKKMALQNKSTVRNLSFYTYSQFINIKRQLSCHHRKAEKIALLPILYGEKRSIGRWHGSAVAVLPA